MKLSTKSRYGVRLMLELALRYGEGPVFLRTIARRQEIPEKYLWHLTSMVKSAGLVNSIRGAHGGYMLAKKPQEITLREIVQIFEGLLPLVECVDTPSFCKRSDSCVARDIWSEVGEKILQVLDSITLENMVERQKEKTGKFAKTNYAI